MPYHHGREIRHYYRLNRSPFLPGFQIHKKGIWEGASWKVLHNSWISGRSLERKKEWRAHAYLPFWQGFLLILNLLWLSNLRQICWLRGPRVSFASRGLTLDWSYILFSSGGFFHSSCLLNKSPIRSWVHNRWWSYISFRCLKYSYPVNQ